jgi:hypothetical protein
MDIDPERIIKSPFFAGMLGSIVSLKWAPGTRWTERAFNAFCGSAMAGFMAPAVAQYLKLDSPQMQGATAFAAGLFGLNLAATGFRWLATLQLSDLLPWRNKKD